MTILAIESSTPRASLALWQDGEIAWESEFTSDRAHNSRIFEPLEEVLEKCDRKIDLVAVGIGPGSYGGVRVGIAVANGLALALGAKTVGISSLETISDEPQYAVAGDARRKSFFLARVRDRKLHEEPELLNERGLVTEVTRLNREGIPVYSSDESVANRIEGVELFWPDARRLAELAGGLSHSEIGDRAVEPLQPHYLRAPYITTPRK